MSHIGKVWVNSSDIDYNNWTSVFRDVISFIINLCDPRRPAPADIKCPKAAQRKQAKRACLLIC